MKATIRIHRQHDMDLVLLYRIKAYHLGREMKRCLVAYANMKPYMPPEFDMNDATKGYVPTSCVIHINLNPNKPEEAAAIELLKQTRENYRCSFIKALFRSSVPYLPLLAFADDSGFITKKANTVSDINHMQTQAVVNNMKPLDKAAIQEKIATDAATKKAKPVVANQVIQPAPKQTNGNQLFAQRPITQQIVPQPMNDIKVEQPVVTEVENNSKSEEKKIEQIVEDTSSETSNDASDDIIDFDSMFAAMDNLGH